MPEISIRHVEGEELFDTLYEIGAFAFGDSPKLIDRDEIRTTSLPSMRSRYVLALYEDGQPVATASNIRMTQQVRGVMLPMGGVASVATFPQARRKGYARQLVAALLEHMHADGQPVSTLYPFRESFYGRLGYATFPQERRTAIRTANLEPLLKQDLPGEVTFARLSEQFDQYRAFMERYQRGQHALALRPADAVRVDPKEDRWLALARHEGEIVGVMVYAIKAFDKLEASRFYYTTLHGRYLLLRWLARHIDQTNVVHLDLPAQETPDTWLFDLQVTRYEHERVITPMGRVVDVTGIDGLPAGDGVFTAKILDPHCVWNQGVFRFEGAGGKLHVTPLAADMPYDCMLTIHGLSALVYTGSDPAEFAFRGWGNPDPDNRATMRAIFPPVWPHLHERF